MNQPTLYLDFAVPDSESLRRVRAAMGYPFYAVGIRIGEDSRSAADLATARRGTFGARAQPPGAIADLKTQLRLINAAVSRQGYYSGLHANRFVDPEDAPGGDLSLLNPPYYLMAESESFFPLGLAATLMVALHHIETRDNTVACAHHDHEHPSYRAFRSLRDTVAQTLSAPSPDAWQVIERAHPRAARLAEMLYAPRADLTALRLAMPHIIHGNYPAVAPSRSQAAPTPGMLEPQGF